MDSVFKENGILWEHCIGVSVDNTSVNLGKRNSILTRVREKNATTYFMGCSCHIMHNTSLKAAECFTHVHYSICFVMYISMSTYQVTKFDVEEMMTDIFYILIRAQRKSELADYCAFCDVEFRQVLKYVSTRWLSLDMAAPYGNTQGGNLTSLLQVKISAIHFFTS